MVSVIVIVYFWGCWGQEKTLNLWEGGRGDSGTVIFSNNHSAVVSVVVVEEELLLCSMRNVTYYYVLFYYIFSFE